MYIRLSEIITDVVLGLDVRLGGCEGADMLILLNSEHTVIALGIPNSLFMVGEYTLFLVSPL
jgi:hypothetical protein